MGLIWVLMQCGQELCSLLQAPGVFHAGPALLGLAVHRAGLELALGQTSPGRFIQTPKAR